MKTYCYICLEETKASNGYHPQCVRTLFGSTTVPTLDIELGKMHTAALAMVGRTSLSGVQKKISVNVSSDRHTLQVAAGGGRYILKPPTETYPSLPENEHLTMKLALLSGIEVAACGLVPLPQSGLAFVTKRFDRLDTGRKVRQEDFCQLAELQPAEKYDGSAELCAKILRKYATEPGIEMLRLYRQLVFAWWIGNGDLHLKNLSLMIGDDRIAKLTPAYDLISTRLVIPEDELALPVCGKRARLKRDTWLEFAQYCQLPNAAAQRVLKQQANVGAKAEGLIEASFLPPEMKDELKALIEQRSGLLTG